MSGKHPYTPAEILDMGRRAEFEGNLDYAAQFYGYLVDGLPGSREANEARAGMERVSKLRDRPANGQANKPPPLMPNVSTSQPLVTPKAHEEVPHAGQPLPRPTLDSPTGAKPPPLSQQHAEPSLGISPAPAGPGTAPPRLQTSPQPPGSAQPTQSRAGPPPHAHWNPVSVTDGSQDTSASLPRVVRRDGEGDEGDEFDFIPGYKFGRFLAFALVLLGWLATIGGFAFVGIAIAGVAGTQLVAEYGALPLGVLVGIAACFAGIAMIFIGSLAQAAFEAANNTRELLEIERANAGW